mmetsp:Transcript_30184/g.80523  ORF Transcript_30184/g.80523 Transcript_30184/m.80523 type:complete len:340 (-) Transcript_30184:613-1632(-)
MITFLECSLCQEMFHEGNTLVIFQFVKHTECQFCGRGHLLIYPMVSELPMSINHQLEHGCFSGPVFHFLTQLQSMRCDLESFATTLGCMYGHESLHDLDFFALLATVTEGCACLTRKAQSLVHVTTRQVSFRRQVQHLSFSTFIALLSQQGQRLFRSCHHLIRQLLRQVNLAQHTQHGRLSPFVFRLSAHPQCFISRSLGSFGAQCVDIDESWSYHSMQNAQLSGPVSQLTKKRHGILCSFYSDVSLSSVHVHISKHVQHHGVALEIVGLSEGRQRCHPNTQRTVPPRLCPHAQQGIHSRLHQSHLCLRFTELTEHLRTFRRHLHCLIRLIFCYMNSSN